MPPIRAVLRAILSFCVIVYLLADELFTRLLRPAIVWLSNLSIFRRIGAGIAALPPYGVLVLLAIPFIIIEPAKVFALYWIASGHLVQGPVLLVLAYVISILSCDRIYHSGHAKLMQIGWFNRLMDWLIALRNRGLAWVRSTAAWRTAGAIVSGVRKRILALLG